MEYVTLNNGLKMPMVGFGVFRVPDKKECEESVYQAIKAGYRLIDTAAAYYNEDAVGAAVKRAIADGLCTREDLFITSKHTHTRAIRCSAPRARHRAIPSSLRD